jgi:hypothetical protein
VPKKNSYIKKSNVLTTMEDQRYNLLWPDNNYLMTYLSKYLPNEITEWYKALLKNYSYSFKKCPFYKVSENVLSRSKNPQPGPILKKIKPLHKLAPCFSNIHFDTFLLSTSWYSMYPLPWEFLAKILTSHFSHTSCISFSSHHAWLNHTGNIRWRVRITKIFIVYFL